MKLLLKALSLFLFVLVLGFTSCQKVELLNETNLSNESNIVDAKSKYITSNGVVLYAGQHIEAGEMFSEIVGDKLYVTYNTTNGFSLDEVHLFIGRNLDEMPKTKTGEPKIGLFPYKESNLDGLTSFEFEIPLSQFGAALNMELFIAAHAVVSKENEDGSIQEETAWAGNDLISEQGSWATYFSIRFKQKVDLKPILKR